MISSPPFHVVAFMLAITLATTACSSLPNDTPDVESLEDKNAQLAAREAALDRRLANIEAREKALKTRAETPEPATAITQLRTGDDLLPPEAKPGECYTRVWAPPTYREVTERVKTQDAAETITVIPATYKTTRKRVLVKEASTKLIAVPATYKTIEERVMVKPAAKKIVKVPAIYETHSEQVIDKPAHTTWKRGTGPIQRIDDTTGEIMCLVEVPASYKTITKRVLKTPATTKIIEEPAIFKTVEKRVIDQPATTETVAIPAEYKMMTVKEIDTPAHENRAPIDAQYTIMTRRELVQDGRMEWRSILCDTNTTPDRISDIQRALDEAGYYPGPIDGIIGVETMRAVNAYQRANDLPVDKYLNIATVKALGVSPH